MSKLSLATCAAAMGVVVAMTAGANPAWAARPPGTSTGHGGGGGHPATSTTGVDVSYPQCGATLPSSAAFAIVGLNGGLANDYNACVDQELSYAEQLTATTTQPVAQLYLNTADPGNTVGDWPYAGDLGPGSFGSGGTPYGTCDPSATETPACAYVYGYDMVNGIGPIEGDVPHLAASGRDPSAYRWWLDVETVNSWLPDTTMNVAALQGMVRGLQDAGVTFVGVYSTSSQWDQITGTPGPSIAYGGGSLTNTLWGLDDWIPGARRESTAVSNCGLRAFTNAGNPLLTQWSGHPLDGDYPCA